MRRGLQAIVYNRIQEYTKIHRGYVKHHTSSENLVTSGSCSVRTKLTISSVVYSPENTARPLSNWVWEEGERRGGREREGEGERSEEREERRERGGEVERKGEEGGEEKGREKEEVGGGRK